MTDDGCQPRTWSQPSTVGELGATSLSLAVGGHGRALLGWSRDGRVEYAFEDVAFQLHTRDQLSTELVGASHQVSLASGPDGAALVTWQQTGMGAAEGGVTSIFAAALAPNGEPTRPPAKVSFGDNAYEPVVAVGPDGDVALTWNQWDGQHYGVALATAGSPTGALALPVSATDVLSPPVFFSNAPRPTVGPNGSLLVSWYQAPVKELMTFVSERADRDSVPTRPLPGDFVSAPGAPVDSHPIANPKGALSENGEAAVVWTQEDGDGHVATYLATRDAAGTWYRPRGLDDSIGGRTGYARCASAAFGTSGDLFVVWEEDGTVKGSLRDADGTWLTPRGEPRLLSSDGTLALDPQLATGSDGTVVVVWREKLDDFSVRASVSASGSGAFTDAVTISSADPGVDAFAPIVAIGGPSDRAVVAWLEGSDEIGVRLVTLD